VSLPDHIGGAATARQHFLGDENLIAQFHRDYFAIMD